MNTKKDVRCVHCGEVATKVVVEAGVEIPLCYTHYRKFIDEEEVFTNEDIEDEAQ